VVSSFEGSPLPKFRSSDLGQDFIEVENRQNVKLNHPTGPSACIKGAKCIALAVVAGIYEKEECKNAIHGAACNFLCGTMANLAYHATEAKNFNANNSDVKYDMVLVHDSSFPKVHLETLNDMGVRLLHVDDSIKRAACDGLKNATMKLDCTAAISLERKVNYEVPEFLIQIMKLHVFTMKEYDAIFSFDTDAYLTDLNEVTDVTLRYLRTKFSLIANQRGLSPVNAGYFVGRPNSKAIELWIDDVKAGFTEENGWANYGPIAHTWPRLWRNPNHRHELGGWNFLGANRDQGLLFHIFALHLQSLGLTNGHLWYGHDTRIPIPKVSGTTFLNRDWNLHVRHLFSTPKPWDEGACKDEKHEQFVYFTRAMLPAVKENFEHHRIPMLRQCLSRFLNNNEVCK